MLADNDYKNGEKLVTTGGITTWLTREIWGASGRALVLRLTETQSRGAVPKAYRVDAAHGDGDGLNKRKYSL